MKFKRIRFKNFLSFGNTFTEIDLDSNLSTLITGENGAGKTTALEAFYYAMTGKPYRKIKLAELINTTNKKELYVEVEFEHKNVDYLLKRGMKPNVFVIMQNGLKIDVDSSTKDYQKMLENLLGVDSDTFANTIFISSKNYTPFLKLKAEDKRNFIENVLNIKMFSEILDKVKIKRTLHTEKHNTIEFNLKNTTDKLNIAKESNTKFASNTEEEIVSCEQSLIAENEKLAPIDAEIVKIDKWLSDNKFAEEIETIKTQIKSVENKLPELLKTLSHDNEQAISNVLNEIKSTETVKRCVDDKLTQLKQDQVNNKNKLNYLLKDYTNNCDRLKLDDINLTKTITNQYKLNVNILEMDISDCKKLIEFYTNTSECPTCKQSICADSKIVSEHIKKLNEKIELTQTKIEELKENLNKEIDLNTKKYEDDFTNIDVTYIAMKKEFETQSELTEAEIDKNENSLSLIKVTIDTLNTSLETIRKSLKDQETVIRLETSNTIELLKTNLIKPEDNLKKGNDRKTHLDAVERFKITHAIDSIKNRIETLRSTKKIDLINTSVFEQDIESIRAEIIASNYAKETIEHMIKILSDKGIKTHIIKKYIPYLNELVNKYLEIFNASYRLTFDPEFDIKISGRGYENLGYNSFSSGEEQRVDLALLFSFYELGKLKNSINTNTLMLDEICDKSLDSDGLNGLFNVLKNMKHNGMTIFNISHRPEVKNRFDKVYNVTKSMFSSLNEE